MILKINGKIILGKEKNVPTKSLKEIDPAEIKRLQELYEKTHPSNIDRIRGCCDRADQA